VGFGDAGSSTCGWCRVFRIIYCGATPSTTKRWPRHRLRTGSTEVPQQYKDAHDACSQSSFAEIVGSSSPHSLHHRQHLMRRASSYVCAHENRAAKREAHLSAMAGLNASSSAFRRRYYFMFLASSSWTNGHLETHKRSRTPSLSHCFQSKKFGCQYIQRVSQSCSAIRFFVYVSWPLPWFPHSNVTSTDQSFLGHAGSPSRRSSKMLCKI